MADTNVEVAQPLIDASRNLIADLTMLPDVSIDPCCKSDALRKIVDALSTAQSNLARKVLKEIDAMPWNPSVESVDTRLRDLFTRLGVEIES